MTANEALRVVPSGEIFIKSRRTRQRFMARLIANMDAALTASGTDGSVERRGNHEIAVMTPDRAAAATALSRVFGVARIDEVTELPFTDLTDLTEQVADRSVARVAGKTFAVRVRRSGQHEWRSHDAAVSIGSALLDASDGVDLDHPQITVAVRVDRDTAALVTRSHHGPDGLPLGTQTRALVMLSGGIDSPVAAWLMMRRGCPLDIIHFQLECNQADHALAVAHGLLTNWGYGQVATLHVIDFEPIKKELTARVHPRLRQVLLKQLMTEAAHRAAAQLDIPLLVTGDSLGQVSSQTAANLVEIDRYVQAPVLRPLITYRKEEIVTRARQIGTYELSIRAREVCDLSEGRPVETAAATNRLRQGMGRLRAGLIDEALTTWEYVSAAEWFPGVPLIPRRPAG
jgi:thiamine biosynthesis protein ThiI